MPDVEIDSGVSLHYDEMGTGRPVIFVHGWAMSGRVWRFQHTLAQSHRLIFLDQRGHGHSSTGNGYGLADFSGDLVSFVEHLDVQGAVLVGWSMGVQVVLEAFPQLRERLAGLVLVGGTPRFTSCDDYPHGKPPVEVKGLGLRLRRDYQKTMGDFFRGMFAEDETDPAQYQRIVHEIVMGGKSPDHEAAQLALQILSVADQREELAGIDRPVLLVHGAEDGICPVGASQYMAQRLPQVELKVMEGCGHAPFMTRPDEFNGVLLDFLARLG
ncbi:O-methylpimelyl-ACP methylesterase [Geomonas limicola]|uniref:O-methylpimelyl-ACP methylesterase n=1 Tax=Geomonas limicola TaxID=2740186 RepID=A0A6V8NG59_9BACT|nr:alpha/beta fold hydrolase [Geomonas limicola]GFO70734.1 O-methylpimelyl-ACP methylesterase [Geomonas limicola]